MKTDNGQLGMKLLCSTVNGQSTFDNSSNFCQYAYFENANVLIKSVQFYIPQLISDNMYCHIINFIIHQGIEVYVRNLKKEESV